MGSRSRDRRHEESAVANTAPHDSIEMIQGRELLSPEGGMRRQLGSVGWVSIACDAKLTMSFGGSRRLRRLTHPTGSNWYAWSDPTTISTGQFDFETVVMHELGH